MTPQEYRRNHKRVYATRGKAAQYDCVRCPAKAREWAQVHGESGSDPWADYVPMCGKCHKAYDRASRIRTIEWKEKVRHSVRQHWQETGGSGKQRSGSVRSADAVEHMRQAQQARRLREREGR